MDEERKLLGAIEKKKKTWVEHVLRGECLLKDVLCKDRQNRKEENKIIIKTLTTEESIIYRIVEKGQSGACEKIYSLIVYLNLILKQFGKMIG